MLLEFTASGSWFLAHVGHEVKVVPNVVFQCDMSCEIASAFIDGVTIGTTYQTVTLEIWVLLFLLGTQNGEVIDDDTAEHCKEDLEDDDDVDILE